MRNRSKAFDRVCDCVSGAAIGVQCVAMGGNRRSQEHRFLNLQQTLCAQDSSIGSKALLVNKVECPSLSLAMLCVWLGEGVVERTTRGLER